MNRHLNHLSPTLFGLALVAFLLPFATVSCEGARTTFTAAQLVTHRVPDGGRPSDDMSSSDCRDISDEVEQPDSWVATGTLLLALAGLVLGIRRIRRGPGWIALGGVVSLVFLWLSGGLADVQLHSGYWLMLGAFVAAWLWHVHLAFSRARATE
jgi:hypothetical protein